MADAPGESEIERLKRELAEALLERDARAAELEALYAETTHLRQWRAEFARVLQSERNKPLWNVLSTLRGAKKKVLGGSGSSNPLDDFQPPPLTEYERTGKAGIESPLPGAIFQGASVLEILSWGKASATRSSEPKKRTMTEGSGSGSSAYVLNSLITFGLNPLPLFRETLRSAKAGECIWVIEPDALVFPSTLPSTSLKHLLLDESEADRREADEEHLRDWAQATGRRNADETVPFHPLSERVFRQTLTEVCGAAARLESVWIESNETSRHYVALVRKTDASRPVGGIDAQAEAEFQVGADEVVQHLARRNQLFQFLEHAPPRNRNA